MERYISDAWKTCLTQFPQDHRVYINFRNQIYPIYNGAPTFTLITSAVNKPGSHNMTDKYFDTLVAMQNKLILDIYFIPTFAYDVATDQALLNWYGSASAYLQVFYRAADDKYVVLWKDGANARELTSAAYPSSVALQVWTRLTISLDLSAAATTGSQIYVDAVEADHEWSGVIDVKASEQPILSVRHLAGTEGDYTINYIRLFNGITATSAQVVNNFRDILDEEIIWHLNGHATGNARCAVRSRVKNIAINKSVERPTGLAGPNSAYVTLMSPDGQFADDQYDIGGFDPANEVYNGTVNDAFMKYRCPIEIETWYGGLFELEFKGKLTTDRFHRVSTIDNISCITLSADDDIQGIRERKRSRTIGYEDYDFCKPTNEAVSLIHTITRLATNVEWFNFLSNSSFENADIDKSWGVSGAGATHSRQAGGLFGGFEDQLVYGAATASVYQDVTFAGEKKLNVMQKWTFSIWIKCAGAANGHIRLSGIDISTATEDEFHQEDWTLAGGEGWKKVSATLELTDNTVNKLRATIYLDSNVTLSLDGAMLVQNNLPLNWFILNSNDGVAAVSDADDAISDEYETMGFDVDDCAYKHPYKQVRAENPVWDALLEIAGASIASYIGADPCGTLKYRTPTKAGYADPTPLETITETQSINAVIECRQANKIVVSGAKYLEDLQPRCYWDASAAGNFLGAGIASSDAMAEIVASGDYWPDPAFYPEYWAKYEEVETGTGSMATGVIR